MRGSYRYGYGIDQHYRYRRTSRPIKAAESALQSFIVLMAGAILIAFSI